jgi:hypothetical protein
MPGVLPGGKGGRSVGLTTLPLACADCVEIWESQRPGTVRACPGLYRDCFSSYLRDVCPCAFISAIPAKISWTYFVFLVKYADNPNFDYNRTKMADILHKNPLTVYYFSPRFVFLSAQADNTVSIHWYRPFSVRYEIEKNQIGYRAWSSVKKYRGLIGCKSPLYHSMMIDCICC